MKLTNKRGFFTTYIIPIIVGIICIMFVTLWTYSQKNIFKNQTMTILSNESELIMESVKSIIQSQMHKGRIDQQRLNFILNGILNKTSLNFLCIRNNDNYIFESDTLPDEIGGNSKGMAFLGRTYYSWKKFNLEKMPPPPVKPKNNMMPKMMPDDAPEDIGQNFDFRNSTQEIIIGIDSSIYLKQIESENRKLLLIFIVGCIGVVVFIAGWIHFLKNIHLKIDFQKVTARNEKLKEMSLAAAGLAHEVKNPLGIIRGFAQKLAVSSEDTESVRTIAEKILDEADITTERLSDFINYAKKRALKSIPLRARNEILEITEMLKYEIEEKDLVLCHDVDDLTIIADKNCLQQILVNIIMNSIHACSTGDKIEFALKKKLNDAIMTIKDTGRGIAPELLKDIFKPYVSGNERGHGIGLAIVKKLVEEHGWEITMRTEVSKGTITEISGIKLG